MGIVWKLNAMLEEKTRSFVFNIITEIGGGSRRTRSFDEIKLRAYQLDKIDVDVVDTFEEIKLRVIDKINDVDVVDTSRWKDIEEIKQERVIDKINDVDVVDTRDPLYYIATDKRFMELVNALKKVFDRGFKNLIDAGY